MIFADIVAAVFSLVRDKILYPLSIIVTALQRKNQGGRELRIRSYFISPRISGLLRGGILLCKIGLGLQVPLVASYILSKLTSGSESCFGGCAFALFAFVALCGWILLIVGALVALGSKTVAGSLGPPPSTNEVRVWYGESLGRISRHALARLDLVPEQIENFQSFSIESPLLWRIPGAVQGDILWRVDGKVALFGLYRITMTFFADRHMSVYTCHFNFIRDVTLSDKTHEFHYQDIVEFSTSEDATSYKLPSGKKLTTAQKFSLTVSSGGSIALGEETAILTSLMGADFVPETGTETAISAIRTLVRDKKETILKEGR